MQTKGNLQMFIDQIITEDQMSDTNVQITGMATEIPPQQMEINNLIKSQQSDDKAPQLQKYPLDKFDDISSDLYINIQNMISMLKSAYSNPSIENKKQVKKCYDIVKSIENATVDLNKNVHKINK